MRPIDGDAVLEFMRNRLDMQELYLPIHFKEFVTDEMPTVSPKQGRWIVQDGSVRCSECGEPNMEWNYCPNCGARMEGEEDE